VASNCSQFPVAPLIQTLTRGLRKG
jgi:hypothetical protein